GAHPVELVDPTAHGVDEVMYELVRGSLGFRREIFGDVELADVVTHRPDGEIDATLPPRLLLRRARQNRAVESEALLVELLRQIGRIGVERTHQKLVAQDRKRRASEQGRDTLEGA